MKVEHSLKPIYDASSKVLILGTMPSVISREKNFYYAHPRNRFWKVLSRVYQEEIAENIADRKAFLKRHHIALFDCLKSCEIKKSSDASIKEPVPNDLRPILKNSSIKMIFTTGNQAHLLYQKFLKKDTGIEDILLPSPSPANCPKGIEKLLFEKYSKIKEYTDNPL